MISVVSYWCQIVRNHWFDTPKISVFTIFQVSVFGGNSPYSTAKIPGSVKKWKVPGIKCIITTVKPKILKKCVWRSANDHGGFQQQSPQCLVYGYEYNMNSRNER